MKETAKGRNTKVRQLVEKIFGTIAKPISLKELFLLVKKTYPKTAYSTVFRIVMRLLEEKKIHQVDWRERGSYYEWAAMEHHHHIVCQTCGKVTNLSDKDVGYDEEYIQQKTGFTTRHHSIELEGICADCRKEIS